ncbi:MAG: OprO/OprP family phosphate-selective porin [Gemmatimonadales bacterium]
MRTTGDLSMGTVRHWGTGMMLGAAIVGTARQAAAQQAVAQQQTGQRQAGQVPADSVPSLEARVEELSQQVRILQRLRELAADSIATAARDRQSATANSKDGFSLASADGKYSLKIRGYAHADGRFFPGDGAAALPNTFFLRRARPILEASVGRYFDFRIMPDFAQGATTLFDAYWDGKFDPAFTVRAGKFKPPVGFERLQSATDITFAERGLPTNLAPNRDIGLQIAGDVSTGLLAYQVGVFNGVADLGNADGDLGEAKDFAARVFVQPFKRGTLKGVGLGISGSTGIERGTATATGLAGYRAPSQQTFFRYRTDPATPANTVLASGTRTRLSPHAFVGLGSLGLLGEYILSRQEVRQGATTAKLDHTAWQASGSYFLTGEQAGFRSPSPKKPFDLRAGTFGAVELAARYGELDLDDDAFPTFANPTDAASKAKAFGVGVNWHLNRQIKVVVNYEHTTFDAGAATGDRESENFVVTRFQHAF